MINWLDKIAMPAMNQAVPVISPQEAHQTCMGPFYHGTSHEIADTILNSGFEYHETEARTPQTSHGYSNQPYANTGCHVPVHHLGYGVYFTQFKARAKNFGTKVLEFYLKKPIKLSIINWGSANTMMKWWKNNGYDCELAKTDRVSATQKMTQVLSSKFDAVLYKGKTMYTLLDGNQLCLYNMSLLRRVDPKLVKPGEIGSKVLRKKDGIKGVLLERREIGQPFSQMYHNNETEFLDIQWQKGGREINVYPSQIIFV